MQSAFAVDVHRHIADVDDRLQRCLVENVHASADCIETHVVEGVHGECLVTGAHDTLPPHVLTEDDHASGGRVARQELLADIPKVSTADERLTTLLDHVVAPDDLVGGDSGGVVPRVLIVEYWCLPSAEEFQYLVRLQATGADESGHIVAADGPHFDLYS